MGSTVAAAQVVTPGPLPLAANVTRSGSAQLSEPVKLELEVYTVDTSCRCDTVRSFFVLSL